MGGGRREPEEELEFFFREVEADADGLEGPGGHLLAHLLDGLDDVSGGEGAAHHAGDEETEVDRCARGREARELEERRGERGRDSRGSECESAWRWGPRSARLVDDIDALAR